MQNHDKALHSLYFMATAYEDLVERLKSTIQLPAQLGKHNSTVDEHELLDLVDTINGLVLQLRTDPKGSQQ